MGAIKKSSVFAFLFILMFSMSSAWTEAGLIPSENPDQSGINDSTDLDLGVYPGGDFTGTGFIADNMDQDYYVFTLPDGQNNPNHDFIKISFYSPPSDSGNYNMILHESDGTGGWIRKADIFWANGNTQTVYADVGTHSAENWDYRIEVRFDYGSGSTINAYAATVSMVDSGSITGKVNPVGVLTSGAGSINVSSLSQDRYISNAMTDSGGNFLLRVPVGVPMDKLTASRMWYSGCPVDWAYGGTEFALNPAVTINSAGQSAAGKDFNVYTEAVLTGTVTCAENVDMRISVPYEGSYSQGYMQVDFTGAYTIHNMAPGTYSVWVAPHAGQSSTQEVSYTAGVTVTDGMTTVLNYNLGTGHTVTGTLNPDPGMDGSVELYMVGNRGSGIDDWDPFKNYFRVGVTGGTYTMNGIPDGIYDLRSGKGGPSSYPASLNTVITSDAVIDFSAPLAIETISGSVIDNTGSLSLGSLYIFATIPGTGEILGVDTPSFFTMTDALGNFTVNVPDTNPSYNIAVLAPVLGSQMPGFVGSFFNAATGSSGNLIYVNNGIKISGEVKYLGLPVTDYNQLSSISFFYPDGPFAPSMCGISDGNPFFDSGSYLPVSATPYNVVVRAKSAFFNDQDMTVSLSNMSMINQDMNLAINAARDKYAPYAGELFPAQNGFLSSGPEPLYVTLSDTELGTGFNTIQILSDGVPVGSLTYSPTGTNTRRYQFYLPVGQQASGTSHSITMNIMDFNGNVFDFNGGSWQVNVVSPTMTPTMPPTPSITPTNTVTQPECEVNGTITMPASSLGRMWIVVLDDDANGGNGFTSMTSGITMGTTQYSYSLTATAGSYYIYSLVDVNGNGSFDDGGIDYAAIYGAAPPTNPPPVANAAVTFPSSTFDFNVEPLPGASSPTITVTPGGPADTPTPVQCILSGTITMPAVSSGQTWFVLLDNDTDGGNGYAGFAMGNTTGTNQFSYNILAPEGTYYLYAAVDRNGLGMPSGPQPGDFMGYFGGMAPSYGPPGSPNAVIACPVGNIDFVVAEIPGGGTPTSTITPGGPTFTFTATPCAISGTVIMPAVSNGIGWYVLIDNDSDGGNGAPVMITGTTTGSNQFVYNAMVSPGTYYIYAVVDLSGQVTVSGPKPGDYMGYFGAIPPLNPPGAPNVSASCLGIYDFNLDIIPPAGSPTFTITPGGPSATSTATVTITPQLANVSGTITMPAVSSGKDWFVLFDDDVDGGNGFAFVATGTTSGTNQFAYNTEAAPGTYYVYAVVDENGTGMPSGPVSGDYAGVYGGGPGPWDAPGTANAVITLPSVSFDFNVVLIPYPTETITPTHSITPTATETITGTPPTSTETPTFTATDTFTGTPSDSPTSTATSTWTLSSTLTPTLTHTLTSTDTASPTLTWTLSSTLTPTLTHTLTSTDTASPTSTWTQSSTLTPTLTYTLTPTLTDTLTSTITLTETPSYTVTLTYTVTDVPTASPTFTATSTVTQTPVVAATATPSQTPSFIAKAYPQPAGNSITFAYKLSKAGKVSVNVFNLSGLPVAALDGGIKGTGDNASAFDISSLAPGIYFYIIKSDTGDKFGVNKFVVER